MCLPPVASSGLQNSSATQTVTRVTSIEQKPRAGTPWLSGNARPGIALEIEWNNKDPFYDRDLENFKRLHADGAISVRVIVTRGRSLHESMRDLVRRFVDERQIQDFDSMKQWGYEPTSRQRREVGKRVGRQANPMTFREAFVSQFVSDKFGEATTHWRKLEERVHRGVGNPCPLLLIGLPDTIVTFNEGKAALAEVQGAEEQGD